MVVVPAADPVTIPFAVPTAATDTSSVDQYPPVIASASVVVVPAHTV